jgi:hypothetical protein
MFLGMRGTAKKMLKGGINIFNYQIIIKKIHYYHQKLWK